MPVPVRTLSLLALPAAALSLPLHATIATYSSQAAYNAATSNNVTYTFPSTFASKTTRTYTVGPLQFQQGVNGHPDGSYYATFNDGLYGANQSYLELTNTTANTEVETILLSTPAKALGFAIGGEGASYSVAINGGSPIATFTTPYSLNAPFPYSFFGITDTSDINSISFTGISTDTDTLFVEVGNTPAVPEPSTFALLGTGIVGAAGALRRRLRSV